MPVNHLAQDAQKGHVLKTVELFSAKEPVWTCPFCASPAFSMPLILEDDKTNMDQQRQIIINHLELHVKDVQNAMKASKMSVPSETERDRSTTRWIDGTCEEYSTQYANFTF